MSFGCHVQRRSPTSIQPRVDTQTGSSARPIRKNIVELVKRVNIATLAPPRGSLVRCQSATTPLQAAGAQALKGVGRPGHAAERRVSGRRVRRFLRRQRRAVDFTRSGVRTTQPLMPTSLSGISQDKGWHLEEHLRRLGYTAPVSDDQQYRIVWDQTGRLNRRRDRVHPRSSSVAAQGRGAHQHLPGHRRC